ncbi:MAG: hypothetical protein ABI330_21480 [Caldimonas sp.]
MTSFRPVFGDIHNHNAHGYGRGSIERSLDVAQTHLDFFAFTGHSSWHDMPAMEGGRERHWTLGFQRLEETWPRVQAVIAGGNRDGEFCAFLGFEWHSSRWGDQCVVFPGDHRPLFKAADPAELRRFCVSEQALMIPHHLAYPAGRRGVNWDAFDEACTPVVEIYSEHGNAENDRGPFSYFSHSMGGRQTSHTATAGLAAGLRFGFVGSSDDHAGFPGAYGEGLMAALVDDLSREAIFSAIRARRTYALTGDRIEVDLRVNGEPMGSTLEAGREVEVSFAVQGRDELDVVEIIQDGRIVHRAFPSDTAAADFTAAPLQLRLEWGWGPWGALALDRVCDWAMRVNIRQGRLMRFFPCLQSMPFDERRRHRFERVGASGLAIRSYSARQGAYRENPNQSVVLEIQAAVDSRLDLDFDAPVIEHHSVVLDSLLRGSHHGFTGPFPAESWQWHRVVPLNASSVQGSCTLDLPEKRSHVYLRVRQRNGHMAWASPVFINYR